MRICDDVPRTRFDVFKEADNSDVAPNQHPVEHVVRFLEVGTLHGHRTKFERVLFHQLVSGMFVRLLCGKAERGIRTWTC